MTVRTKARNGWAAVPRRIPAERFTWRLRKVYLIERVGNLVGAETGSNGLKFAEKVYSSHPNLKFGT